MWCVWSQFVSIANQGTHHPLVPERLSWLNYQLTHCFLVGSSPLRMIILIPSGLPTHITCGMVLRMEAARTNYRTNKETPHCKYIIKLSADDLKASWPFLPQPHPKINEWDQSHKWQVSKESGNQKPNKQIHTFLDWYMQYQIYSTVWRPPREG